MKCLALQHHMADAIYTIQQTVDEQRYKIDGLKSDVSEIKRNLNRLIGSVDLMTNAKPTSAESNYIT